MKWKDRLTSLLLGEESDIEASIRRAEETARRTRAKPQWRRGSPSAKAARIERPVHTLGSMEALKSATRTPNPSNPVEAYRQRVRHGGTWQRPYGRSETFKQQTKQSK